MGSSGEAARETVAVSPVGAREAGTSESNERRKEAQRLASHAALRFQIPPQPSLLGIVQTHRPSAAQMARFYTRNQSLATVPKALAASGLQVDNQKDRSIRTANDSSASG